MDGGAVQLLLRAGPEGLRLRRQPDLDHPEARRSRSTSPRPYYTAEQAVVALKDSDAAERDLARRPRRTPSIGVQIGTTSLDAVNDGDPAVAASRRSSTTPTTSSRALKNGQVDAVVVDLPTALYLTAVAGARGDRVVGQFPAPGGDEWGALLEKDSPLTACVSAAIDELQRLRRARRDRGAVDRQPRRRCSQLQYGRAGAAPVSADRGDRRAAARRRPRRRRARRGQAIAAVSTVVVLGGLAALILTSPGWPDGPRDVLQLGRLQGLVPGRPRRLLARRQAVHGRRGRRCWSSASLVALVRTSRRPGAVPAAAARDRLHRRLPRHPDDPARLPDRLRRPGARQPRAGCRPTRSCSAGSRWRSPTAPTSPRSTAPGSTRSTAASATRRSRSASPSARRCAT